MLFKKTVGKIKNIDKNSEIWKKFELILFHFIFFLIITKWFYKGWKNTDVHIFASLINHRLLEILDFQRSIHLSVRYFWNKSCTWWKRCNQPIPKWISSISKNDCIREWSVSIYFKGLPEWWLSTKSSSNFKLLKFNLKRYQHF